MGRDEESEEGLAKYLVTLETVPGLKPYTRRGFIVKDKTLEGAREKALAKIPRTGKFKHRTKIHWRVIQVQLLGGVDGSKAANG